APEEERQLLFTSVGALLRNIARTRPLVIILDDLQGADHPSALLLRFVVESLATEEAARMLVLGCCRTVAPSRGALLGDLLAALAGAGAGSSVELHGLEARDVARFIEAYAGSAAPPELLTRMSEISEGNPLFLKECAALLASANARGEPGVRMDALTIPSTL